MKESGNHDEIVGEYNVNFGRENNPPFLQEDFTSEVSACVKQVPKQSIPKHFEHELH